MGFFSQFRRRTASGKTPSSTSSSRLLSRSESVPSYGGVQGGHLSGVAEEEEREDGERDETHPVYTGGVSLAIDEDDEDGDFDAEDDDEEEEGVYRGTYARTVLLYSIVPLFSLIVFVLLALVPYTFYPLRNPHQSPSPTPDPSPSTGSTPLFQIFLLTASVWSLSHILRSPIYSVASSIVPAHYPKTTTTLFAFLIALSTNLLRLLALPLLLRLTGVTHHAIEQDLHHLKHGRHHHHPNTTQPSFRSIWFFGLIWAGADVLLGICQGYQAIALYKDAFVRAGMGEYDGEEDIGLYARGGRDEEIVMNGKVASVSSLSSLSSTSPLRMPRVDEGAGAGSSAAHTAPAPAPGHGHGHGHSPTSPISPTLEHGRSHSTQQHHHHQHQMEVDDPMTSQQSLDDVLQHDLDTLLALEKRTEIEEVYGMAFIRIPVFISCLLRIDTLFTGLGFTLLTSAAYLRYITPFQVPTHSTPAPSPSSLTPNFLFPLFPHPHPNPNPTHPSNPLLPLLITLPVVVIVHTIMAALSSAPFLSRVGVQSVAYVGLFVGLVSLFAGLGVWEGVQ